MELVIGAFGSISSILALGLAFYTIFINGRAIRRMLREHGQMLERISETLRYVAELVRIEGEKTREAIHEEGEKTREEIGRLRP